jgi:signal transduction histidine kinase
MNDILSNVLLNAIEAAERGGHVRLAFTAWMASAS